MAHLGAGLLIAQLLDHRGVSYYRILRAVPAHVGAVDRKRQLLGSDGDE